MADLCGIWLSVCGCVAVSLVAGGGAQPGTGLTVKDMQRVEQVRGDAGGLSHSLARGPASLMVPNDFSGVYQIPEDADSPYAGWFARVQGAQIAVFPRGEYVATRVGMIPKVPANTRFFLGSVPMNAPGERASKPVRVPRANERIDTRATWSGKAPSVERPVSKPQPDAPRPVTLDTATDLAGVKASIQKLCSDQTYRADRLRVLVDRAARVDAARAEADATSDAGK